MVSDRLKVFLLFSEVAMVLHGFLAFAEGLQGSLALSDVSPGSQMC